MENKKAREILDKLIQNVDSVRAEFTYTDDIDRNIELQVNVALLSLKELVTNKINEAEEWGDLIDKDDIREAVAKLFWEEK